MDETVARFIRLKHAVRAAAQTDDPAMSGEALGTTYNQLRNSVRDALPSGVHSEFDQLFPMMEETKLGVHDILERSIAGATAKTRLNTLAGWLEGHIEAEKEAR